MFKYIDNIKEIIKTVENSEAKAMAKAADVITKAIVEGNSLYVFGAGHAGILSEELFYRAGGLALVNPIFAKEMMLDNKPITITSQMERLPGYGVILAGKQTFKPKDVLIVHSVSGRNTVGIDMALEARKKGVIVIALTNVAYSASVNSRHESGKNLYECCDIVLDNHGDFADASILVDDNGLKVGASSTVIGAMILNAIIVQVVENLKGLNFDPLPVFHSANVDGGDEKNKEIFETYKSVIHYM